MRSGFHRCFELFQLVLWLVLSCVYVDGQQEAAMPLDQQEKNPLDSLGQLINNAAANIVPQFGASECSTEETCSAETAQNGKGGDRNPFSNVKRHESSQSNGRQEDFSLGTLSNLARSLISSMSGDDQGGGTEKSSISSGKSSSQLAGILQKARSLSSGTDVTRTRQEEMNFLWDHMNQVYEAVKRSFSHVEESIEKLHPLAFWYYVEHTDGLRNPSWKRRKHYYMKELDTSTVEELHDALFLSQLSYAHSVDDIEHFLKDFQNNSWELIYGTTEGRPTEPAHFVAIQKESKQDKSGWLPWQRLESSLDVLMVIRGTKEIGDLLSDGLLEPTDYRGGKAHAGIVKAGTYIAKKHRSTLEEVLGASKRDNLRLTIVGHSLGAGAAAIVAMEYNDHPQIDVSAIGFGCPALVSLGISEAAKDYVTSVVSDSDIVPRMSGAAIANMFLDVASYDWTAKGLEDLEDFLVFVNTSMPLFDVPVDKIVKWADGVMDEEDRPYFQSISSERSKPELFPPGDCIHVFRDGFGFTGSYTPCDFFDSVEMSRTMLHDHLIPPGYHRALLSLMRDSSGDFRYDFQHDLMALPV